jgi:hypothetical protein
MLAPRGRSAEGGIKPTPRFVKDVGTLADAGELMQTLAAIRELSRLTDATERRLPA